MMQSRMQSYKDVKKPHITAEMVKPYMEKYGLDTSNANFMANMMTEIFTALQVTEDSAIFDELMDAIIRHDAETRSEKQ